MADISLDVAFRLIKLLNTHKQVTYKTIMDEFGVSRNTAYRYLGKLERFFPVYSPENGGKAYKLITDYTIDGTQENADFAFIATLMDFAIRTLSNEYSKDAQAMKKRLFSLPRYGTHHFQTGEAVDYAEIADKVAIIEKYILSHTAMDMHYKKKDKRYKINPYRILFSGGNWYVLADHCGDFKTFHLHYIVDIEAAGSFVPRNEDAQKYATEIKNIWHDFNAEAETAVVLIHQKLADYFRQRQILPEQKIEKENTDGSLEISFKVTGAIEFQKLMMEWFPWFKVISPMKYKDTINELINLYQGEWK